MCEYNENLGDVQVLGRWVSSRARMWRAARLRLLEDGTKAAWRVLVRSVVEGLQWTYEGQHSEASTYIQDVQDQASEFFMEDGEERLKVIKEQKVRQVQAARILRNIKVHRLQVPLLALSTEEDLQEVEAFRVGSAWEVVPVQGA